jgi:hypothetical protein
MQEIVEEQTKGRDMEEVKNNLYHSVKSFPGFVRSSL